MKKRVKSKIHKRAGLRIEEISFGKQIKREIDEDIEEVEKEIKQAERWIIARKKFFINYHILFLRSYFISLLISH